MEPRSLQSIAAACGGHLNAPDPEAQVTGVSVDSRRIQQGDLFVALRGERFDGHAFLPAACAQGAHAVLGETLPRTLVPGTPATIRVEDSRRALGDLAAWYRTQFNLPLIAVAGSNGKTSTKDLLASVLAQQLRTLASESSFNNDVGVPLTLLRLQSDHQAAVVEAGTNHPGELAALLQRIRPTLGVLTSLGREHLEFFGDYDGVVAEEGALAEALPAHGRLFLAADVPGASTVAARSRAPITPVGWTPNCAWQALDAQVTLEGTRFLVRSPSPSFDGWYHTQLVGRHQVVNALLALAVGAHSGLDPAALASGLAQCAPPAQRLQTLRAGGVTLLNDTYNANADSMRAALEVLRALPGTARRIAVLGDMAELGPQTTAAHQELGRHAATAGLQLLVAIGQHAPVTAASARLAGGPEIWTPADADEAAERLARWLKPGDLVLVKASRAARLERVVDRLQHQLESTNR